MGNYYDEDYYPEDYYEEQPRDSNIDRAKILIYTELFEKEPENVFYGRQIQVLFEDKFFHWITEKALKELVAEGTIKYEEMVLKDKVSIRFYMTRNNRYWKRKAESKRKLIAQYSTTEFGKALGHHSEILFDSAMAKYGFMPKGENVKEYKGKKWTETGHNLDRIYERDGIAYGAELKNTLSYIDRDELEIKLEMCKTLELKPLFIMRMAPKSYIWEYVGKEGGFSLIFKYQLYPFGFEWFAKEVRRELALPVDCPRVIESGTIERFFKWHEKNL
ncbi:MAG: hypothetical protein AB1424_17990 [Thermodesulfobacteriota bacterium]